MKRILHFISDRHRYVEVDTAKFIKNVHTHVKRASIFAVKKSKGVISL
jgi:hypothetical protein